jgi:hypothetical protein
MPQNHSLVLVGPQDLIGCFLFGKILLSRKMYTIFSAVHRQQRKSDVMAYFGLTACSAVYYHAGSSLYYRPTVSRHYYGRHCVQNHLWLHAVQPYRVYHSTTSPQHNLISIVGVRVLPKRKIYKKTLVLYDVVHCSFIMDSVVILL